MIQAGVPVWLQWADSIATVLLGLVGAGFGGAQAWTAWAAHRADQAERKEAAKRAHLTVTIGLESDDAAPNRRWGHFAVSGLKPMPGTTSPVLRIAVTNTGERTAKRVRVRLDFHNEAERLGWCTQKGGENGESGWAPEGHDEPTAIDRAELDGYLRLNGIIADVAPGDTEFLWARWINRGTFRYPARVTTRCANDDNVHGAHAETTLTPRFVL